MKPRWPFDLRDALTFGGLASLAFGLWQVFPPAAYVVVGAVLVGIGLFYEGAR